MKTIPSNRYVWVSENAISREAFFHTPRPPRGQRMDLRCPNCNSSDLKKASLAYKEGLNRGTSKSRLRALLFGDGPNVILGSAETNGVYQTELSKSLRPPRKRSYGRLLLWAALVSFVWLISYIHVVMASALKVSSLPVVVFGAVGVSTLLIVALATWRYNQLVYPRRYEEWNRSVLCQRCGNVSVLRG